MPLAVELAKHFDTVGLDIDDGRIAELRRGVDSTLEVHAGELADARRLRFSVSMSDVAECNTFIITVPTPIDDARRPDLSPLISASDATGHVLKHGDVVIYESTVYPGCTEEVCVPVLEKASGLKFNRDFFVGYSPERVNPGDRARRIGDIVKVTSGSTPETADYVDALYGRVIAAGTHKASSIRVAEAAKVTENTQRDVNIALINDLAMLFNRLGIDTLEVLEAAQTKWNFLPFRPGLVGGHCIGVDPYYLMHKAQQVGHHPDVILAARRTNDGIGAYVAGQVVRLMAAKAINPVGASILVLGLAFKENCPDVRNTRVVDVISALREYNARVDVWDPWVDRAEAKSECGVDVVDQPLIGCYDVIVLAVGHAEFVALGAEGIRAFGKPGAAVYDVKCALPRHAVDARL